MLSQGEAVGFAALLLFAGAETTTEPDRQRLLGACWGIPTS